MTNVFVFGENLYNISNFYVISNNNMSTMWYDLEIIYHRIPFLLENLLTDISIATF